ncbi:hypothetical protein C8J57DRAFT_643599 [Mycena rebaudengoi]|nr:hypothetical protein C8J57DRAFT_643599 [Mycena rebaudengoi]
MASLHIPSLTDRLLDLLWTRKEATLNLAIIILWLSTFFVCSAPALVPQSLISLPLSAALCCSLPYFRSLFVQLWAVRATRDNLPRRIGN